MHWGFSWKHNCAGEMDRAGESPGTRGCPGKGKERAGLGELQ